jgi:hypothetical protein
MFQKQADRAGVYRFRLQDAGGVTGATFTGEAPSLRQRMGHYRQPDGAQLATQRISETIRSFLATAGASVLLEVVASARSAGSTIDLASAPHRRLLERALIAACRTTSLNL